jgi:competence protein ComEA
MKRSFTIYALGMLVVLLASPHVVRAQSATPATPATPAKPASKPKTSEVKYNLNTASKVELMKLTGVDAATADKIIAARPYTSKKELVSKKVMTQSEYERIHEHVMVKSNPQAAPKKTGR